MKKIILVLSLTISTAYATDYNVLINSSKYNVLEIDGIPEPIVPSTVNLARIGTNGLIESNYSASTTFWQDTVVGAFDGYMLEQKIVQEDVSKFGLGRWLSYAENENQWVSVDFNQSIDVTSVKFLSQSINIGYNNLPKNIIIQQSEDGVSFTDAQSFVADNIGTQSFMLDEAINTRYLRIFFIDNYGNTYIQVDEIEVY